MSPLGIGPREVISLARHAGDVAPKGPILVVGVLAEQLARELSAGGDPSLVRTRGNPADAAALVCVLAGAATAADEDMLRAATRALVPVVAIQTGPTPVRIRYRRRAAEDEPHEEMWGKGQKTKDDGVAREKLVVTVDHHGNTSAASVPLALDEYVRAGKIRTGHRLLLQGVGGGFTWGSSLVTL